MTIWCMRTVCWTPKLLLFHFNNGCKNAPQCYVIRNIALPGEYFIYFIHYIKFSEGAKEINEKPRFDSQATMNYYD